MYGVAIVMDPAFGRLPELAARLHVWVIDTPENRALAVTLYGVDDQGVTLFKAATAEDPNAVVASMLSTIDDHHGEHSHDPPWSFIEVHGATPTGDLEVALAEYGLNKIERLNATSFIASRAS